MVFQNKLFFNRVDSLIYESCVFFSFFIGWRLEQESEMKRYARDRRRGQYENILSFEREV